MNGPSDVVSPVAQVVWRNSVHLACTAGPLLLLAGLGLRRWPAARHALAGIALLWLLMPVPVAHRFSVATLAERAPVVGASDAAAGTTALPAALAWLWAAGALATGVRLWQRRRAHWLIAQTARALRGAAPGVRILSSQACTVPFTIGSLAPVVVLPRTLVESAAPATLAAVIAHECAHARRRDDLRVVFELWLRALYFFHPLVWLLLAWREEDRERLCDRAALCASGLEPHAYGRALLAVLGLATARPSTAPGLGARDRLRRRLHDIADGRASASNRPLLATALALALGVLALPFGADAAAALLRMPVEGAHISSHFGARTNPLTRQSETHAGIDLAATAGRPVVAALDGQVELATDRYAPAPGRGRVVVLRHESGLRTLYAQLDTLAPLAAGDRVTRGQPIGTVGSSGRATGPHLHFEVWRNDAPVDPLPLLTDTP